VLLCVIGQVFMQKWAERSSLKGFNTMLRVAEENFNFETRLK